MVVLTNFHSFPPSLLSRMKKHKNNASTTTGLNSPFNHYYLLFYLPPSIHSHQLEFQWLHLLSSHCHSPFFFLWLLLGKIRPRSSLLTTSFLVLPFFTAVPILGKDDCRPPVFQDLPPSKLAHIALLLPSFSLIRWTLELHVPSYWSSSSQPLTFLWNSICLLLCTLQLAFRDK